MLATLSLTFTSLVEQSTVIPEDQKSQIYTVLEDDAQLMSNTQLEVLVADEPPAVADEIVRINTEARPFALQVALLVPLIAGLLGLAASFAMVRLPDIKPQANLEGLAFD
jgi:hypothetical protein